MAEYVDEGKIDKSINSFERAQELTPSEPAAEDPVEEPAIDWLQPEPSAEEPQAEEPVPYEPETVEREAEAELENNSTRPGSSVSSISAASWMFK
ncbi:hypothetical protein DL95DRAFT_168142 [Leptodontidium sp. 2 PMI_412]|nr:hypothetical protein DL95DRAFT_168142 [Leptodontidium sp. 2 PMI_412]